MNTKTPKLGKGFLVFAGCCIIALPFVVMAAFSYDPANGKLDTAIIEHPDRSFDNNGNMIFDEEGRISKAYLEGLSTERTLDEYYDRRQYLGSPPFIPHTVEAAGVQPECLTCHENGGWTEELRRHTPITPHPEQAACRQCHVPMTDSALFTVNQWMSLTPPRLGRSHLPGSPPPIPHGLQMRGNCIACHVGPGAVTAIRVSHADRGNCRQCHVPDIFPGMFQRQ
jgi:nitrate reductase (cytochrome), electron transfer subunit